MPGLLCDDRLWAQQIADLADIAHAEVADLTRDDDLDIMAHRALSTMPDRFALCGLSMGGYAALALMRLAPERVTRLCLMDTSARPDTDAQARRRRGLMGLLKGQQFRGVTPRLLPSLIHPDRLADTALASLIIDMADAVGRDAFLRQQTAILARPDSRPDLPGFSVPTLVAVGSHDAVTPPDHAEEMAALIPSARLQIIPACGHLPPLERPAETSEILRQWLIEAI
jgi:pimeloyl-ACP methyl ester carboxylesterase